MLAGEISTILKILTPYYELGSSGTLYTGGPVVFRLADCLLGLNSGLRAGIDPPIIMIYASTMTQRWNLARFPVSYALALLSLESYVKFRESYNLGLHIPIH